MHRRVATSNSTQREDGISASINTTRATKRTTSSSSSKSGIFLLLIAGLVGLLTYQNILSKQELDSILKEESLQITTVRAELDLQKSLFEEERRKLKTRVEAAEMKANNANAEDKEKMDQIEEQNEFYREQMDHLKREMQKDAKFNVLEK